MITKSPQYVNRTAAGKQISAWAVVRNTGPHAGEIAAKISAHYSGSRVLVNVSDVEGFKSATGQRLETALSYLTIDGVRMFDHCTVPEDGAKWLKKAAAIYRKYQLPELPDLGLDPDGMKWADYVAEMKKRITPEYKAANEKRNAIRDMRAKVMQKLKDQIAARGMQFANGDDNGPSSIYYISGLDRLAAMGYTVAHII
ncbi:hypothetical protein phiA034_gene0047 [Aeromonas phage phiA034]|uniref:Uncharacterized protein n=1 Tax=Aeromonas phage phiA034 TaxID=2985287 RepID=A0AAF0C0Q0_9CAUD|nr:hypothetical protein phiA034_gene0047 [Aeromonas phage phiA034]